MRKVILTTTILLASLAVLAACAAGLRSPAPSVDLGGYRCVLMHEAGDLGNELAAAFRGMGFDVREAGTDEDKAQTLVLRVQHLTASGKTRAKVRLYELASGREIYSAQASADGETYPESVLKAARAALVGFYERYDAPAPNLDALMAESGDDKAKTEEVSPEKVASTESKEPQGPERMQRTEDELKKYFDGRGKDLVEIEGIWTNKKLGYSLAIFQDKRDGRREFAGMYLKGKDKDLTPGDVVLDIAGKNGQAYPATYRGPGGSTSKGSFSLKPGELVGLFKDASGHEMRMALTREHPAASKPPAKAPAGATVGSGFLLSTAGLIATNHHVIRDAMEVSVTFPTLGKRFAADIVMKDERNDLAILRLREAGNTLSKLGPLPYHLARPQEVALGQDIVTMGFPLGSELGESHKITTGVISALNGVRGEPGRLQISNSIQPGNSGGPVFNRKGQVVGVVVGALDDEYYLQKKGFVPQNVNFAVKINYLHSMIDLIPEAKQCQIRPAKARNPADLEHLVKDYSPFVVMIRSKTTPKG